MYFHSRIFEHPYRVYSFTRNLYSSLIPQRYLPSWCSSRERRVDCLEAVARLPVGSHHQVPRVSALSKAYCDFVIALVLDEHTWWLYCEVYGGFVLLLLPYTSTTFSSYCPYTIVYITYYPNVYPSPSRQLVRALRLANTKKKTSATLISSPLPSSTHVKSWLTTHTHTSASMRCVWQWGCVWVRVWRCHKKGRR